MTLVKIQTIRLIIN